MVAYKTLRRKMQKKLKRKKRAVCATCGSVTQRFLHCVDDWIELVERCGGCYGWASSYYRVLVRKKGT